MKTTFSRIIVLVALLVVPFFVQARQTVPIVDYPDNAVTTRSGTALTIDQVKNAISNAAQSRNWQLSPGPKGDTLQATLNVRGKHTVAVDIAYTAQTYSITYQTSTNMKYSSSTDSNTRLIHPFYNNWVSDLRESIRSELNKY